MSEPITGTQYEICAGPYRAVITESGAGLRALTCDGRDLILTHGADETPPLAAGRLLAPWPNRIDHGRYAFDGAAHQLDVSEPARDCAIHGLAGSPPWTPQRREPDRIVLLHRLLGHAGYPFRLDLTAEYALDAGAGLSVRMTASNVGARAAPYGHGAHPYLTVGAPIDDCTVSVPGDRYLPTGERKLPAGPAADVTGTPFDLREPGRFGGRIIDHAYTGLHRDARGRAEVLLTGPGGRPSVRLWADGAHPWLEIYTADDFPAGRRRLGLAVEPMTCAPNAFVTGEGLIRLEPGATVSGSWGIMAG